MPSRVHAVYARLVPRVRKAEEMGGPEPHERDRVERWHLTLDRTFPTRAVPGFHRRFSLVREELGDEAGGFPAYVVTPRRVTPTRTLLYLHGGGFMAPIDPFQVRYITRLATALGARVVMPDYPLAPEHTWRDSHDAVVELAARWSAEPGGIALVGDSSGGGYALAVAIALRERGRPQATHLVLHAPWGDLTTSTPETDAYDKVDPWLFIGKLRAYALWWAGSPDDLGRPEVSPALADLAGLPPGLMFCGTRDLLVPGCRLLARRGQEAEWPLTYVEQPGLIHAYPVLPFLPEARPAFRQTVAFLGGGNLS
jgi:acetyl esterase/lipase